MNRLTRKLALALALTLGGSALLTGCADRNYRQGMRAIEDGRQAEGVQLLEQAAKDNPLNARIRVDWLTQRDKVINALNTQAEQLSHASRWDEATARYQQTLALDAGNSIGQAGLLAIERGRRQEQLIKQAQTLQEQDKLDASQALLAQVLAESPGHSAAKTLKRQIEEKQASRQLQAYSLNTLYTKPITLELRDANLKMALEGLSRTTGINFVMDKDVRPDANANLFVKDGSLEQVIDMMLSTNQLQKKVLNEKTVLIYPARPDKVREYQELAIRSFYLSNADVRKALEVIRTFVKTRDAYVDERLNLLILRDTPEAIRVAERLVGLLDLPEPEVMLEVEVLEIQDSRLRDLGIKFPQQVNLNILGSAANNALRLSDLRDITEDRVGVSAISAGINLQNELGKGNILANPRIRTRNREKAKIKIGDRVPVISTTQMISSGTAGNFTSDAIQYLDVGLSVEAEPNIYLDDELAIKLSLEVSSVTREVKGSGGSLAYQIGTRNINTVLRLKDGETQVLGGLIRDDDRKTMASLPGLGDLPILGRLFSSQRNEKIKTEIVLSITPRLIRNIQRPHAREGQFWSGTEVNINDGRLGSQALPAAAPERGQEQNPTINYFTPPPAEPGMFPVPPAPEL